MRKTNLKTVETETKADQYDADIATHIYAAKSILAVISGMDTEQLDAFEDGNVQSLALEGKIRLDKALDLLNP